MNAKQPSHVHRQSQDACEFGFDTPSRHPFFPESMRQAPPLDSFVETAPPSPRYALLLNPFYSKDPHGSFGKHVLTPSLALTALAGATPPHWRLEYWDENLLQGPPPHDPFPEVVGITVHLTFARRAFKLATWYRNRGARVILGGLHVQSCPDECAPYADALAIGDGSIVWPQILQDIEAGQLEPVYQGSYREPYRLCPSPRREIVSKRDFLTRCSLIATRGCHNRCNFCYQATKGVDMPYQMKDVEQVAAEFESSGEPYGVFTDNNLGSSKRYLADLCRALKPLDKIWSAAVTIDITDDPGLIREMALAGCTGVFVGFETVSAANLTDAGKKSPRPEDYTRRVNLFHRYGIAVNGSFVFGFDHDRPDCFERTIEWIESASLECATFHILTPYPGTPLFEKMKEEGRLLHENWDLYDTSHVVFQPRWMSPEQLQAGYEWSYRRLFSHVSILRRRPRELSQLPGYLAMCYLYKKSNRLWPWLIRHRLTHAVWAPFIELARRKHLRFRRRLEQGVEEGKTSVIVSPGV